MNGHEYKPFAYYSRSVLRINVTEMANYTCYAINQMIGGRQSVDQESFMVYVQSEGKKKRNFYKIGCIFNLFSVLVSITDWLRKSQSSY